MELSNVHTVAFLAFLAAVAYGAIAHHTRFCTMGAISDWIFIGDTSRLRAWFLAIGIAILGSQLLTVVTPIDLRKSIYLTTSFGWFGHFFGGLLFGIGMTLASGCGQRTLVRVGGGNLKSLVVFIVLAISAYATLRGILALVRINVVERFNIDLTAYDLADQSIDSLIAHAIGIDGLIHWIVVAIAGVGILGFVFSSAEFRRRFDQIFAGVSVGLIVVAGWYITGVVGFDEFEPVHLESYTFVAPVAESLQYTMTYTGSTISFGVAAVFGLLIGSFLYAVATGNFRWEGFASREDLMAHLIGAVLMGFGGVIALGCTVGQGITGMSTLALGSLVTLVTIILGSAVTMKMQYYLLDRQGFLHALHRTLADFRLFPSPRSAKTV